MNKRIIIGLAAAAIVVGGVAAMSAFEAHIINVTAKIENALAVSPEHIDFGTVFPQEYLERPLTIALSGSFLAEDRVDDIEYVIKQKPKPIPVTPPIIDGVIDAGEWDGADFIPVTGGMGTVSLMADTNYLYVLFNVMDPTDNRVDPAGYGNDKIGLNINPTDGGNWGKPYDIVFQTGTDPAAFNTPDPDIDNSSSGLSDGYETEWVIGGIQSPLPGDVETMTVYTGSNRVSEWKVPLSSIGPEAGDELKIGGACDNLANSGNSYSYPENLDWNNSNTFYSFIIPAYLDLCPYLSKTPDNTPDNDTGVLAFHDPGTVATGYLSKIAQDTIDNWIIDLDVPCFEGMCAQDWTHFGFELPAELEHQVFGCDLWIEVTRISETPERQIITTTDPGWPNVVKAWLADGRWGDGGTTVAENEQRIDNDGGGDGSIWIEQHGDTNNGMWQDGLNQSFTLTYDGVGNVTWTIGNYTLNYDISTHGIGADGNIGIVGKTNGADGTDGKVTISNIRLDGLAPTTGPDNFYAQGTSGFQRGLESLVISGDTQLSDGFTLTGDVQFDWETYPSQEGPAFQITVEDQ